MSLDLEIKKFEEEIKVRKEMMRASKHFLNFLNEIKEVESNNIENQLRCLDEEKRYLQDMVNKAKRFDRVYFEQKYRLILNIIRILHSKLKKV